MSKVKRMVGVALVALIAPLLTVLVSGGVTASPAVAADAPCHGYVYNLHKNQDTGKVKLTYWVYCSKHVERIHVRAFLREGDRWAYARADCYNTYVCVGKTGMADHAGRQLYTARGVEGGDLADVTYVKNGKHALWGCGGTWGDYMKCTGGGKYF